MPSKLTPLKKWKIFAEMWSQINWPWRPSPQDLQFWSKYLKKIRTKNPRAVILGSTPEIRDLLAKHKIETTLLDRSPEMPKALGIFMKTKGYKTKYVRGDWLRAGKYFPENYFDFVLGHGVLNNILWQDYKILLKNISKVLKPKGLFLLQGNFARKHPISLQKVIEKFKKEPKFFSLFQNRAYILNCFTYSLFYNKKTKVYSWGPVKKILLKEIRKQKMPLKIIDKIWPIKGNYIDHYKATAPKRKELLKLFRKYFKILEILPPRYHLVDVFYFTIALKNLKK